MGGLRRALRGAGAAWRAEPRSKVAFDIEEAGRGVVELTVVHDGFAPGSDVLESIAQGWPAVLSSLKTLLETGSALQEGSGGGRPAAGCRASGAGTPCRNGFPA